MFSYLVQIPKPESNIYGSQKRIESHEELKDRDIIELGFNSYLFYQNMSFYCLSKVNGIPLKKAYFTAYSV